MAYNHMPPKTAAYYAATCIYINTKLSPIELVEQEYEAYKKHFPQSPYLTNLKQAISFKKTIADGKPAFDFDIVTPEGKKMKLSDLKGNVVYIDFWSSGCVPCLAEMPDAKKVREHFTDKQVKFVYVSLDIDDAAWQKAIKRFNVDAINTRVDKQYESEAAQKYGVYGTPSHFLIDEDGNFASTDGLARPSDPEKLIAQIQKLLK
jgi:thiol-disulfide isomerase/thioredoxin